MTRKVQALVVGGGPSGLAVAYGLQGNTLVLEKESRVGGLCRSIEHGDGVFDIGGHSFHTPHPEVYELVDTLLPGGLFEQKRDAQVYFRGTLVPYPFQKHFDSLPFPDVVRECKQGLLEASSDGQRPRNFEEYIVRRFGRGIADHFMLPYNRKLWARDITRISCEWTSERVAGAKGHVERFETQGGERKPLQPDTRVGYPRSGGYEQIFRAFVSHIPALELNREVTRIDPQAKVATTSGNRSYGWEFLVSTLPLPVLVRVVVGTPDEIVEAADRLEYMSLRVQLLLADGGLETPIQRVYVADPDIPPHKIALNHNSSDSLRQRRQHAIMAEVSLSPEKPVAVEKIGPRTISFLCDIGLLADPDEVVWTGHVDVKYAYPVYTHERPELVRAIKEWMAQRDIYSVGRFGDWAYINSDKCIAGGLGLAKRLRERYPLTTAAGVHP